MCVCYGNCWGGALRRYVCVGDAAQTRWFVVSGVESTIVSSLYREGTASLFGILLYPGAP